MKALNKIKVIFLGTTKFSHEILIDLINNGINISALFTIPQEFSISYSKKKVKNFNYVNFEDICKLNNIPCYLIESSEKDKTLDYYYDVFQSVKPDVILVMGWYYMIPKKIRSIAKYGAWGIHASLLPNYAGGAPLVWSIINGEKETGVTLFKLDAGVDDGDIIAQSKIPIEYSDSIKEVYEKVIIESKNILFENLLNIKSVKFKPQDKTKLKIYPQRTPEDGEIDLTKPAEDLYNFIRAQSNPYPGAYIKTIDGKKLIIEKARIE
jgi:methionyl-tRNA formyltransferase